MLNEIAYMTELQKEMVKRITEKITTHIQVQI